MSPSPNRHWVGSRDRWNYQQSRGSPRHDRYAGRLIQQTPPSRRSSAVGIGHRPPLPSPAIGGRSHSLDGLLDREENTETVETIEGASEQIPTPLDTIRGSDDDVDSPALACLKTNPPKPNQRKSLSFENLLENNQTDNTGSPTIDDDCGRSQSVDCLLDESVTGNEQLPSMPLNEPSTNAITGSSSNGQAETLFTLPTTAPSATVESEAARSAVSRQNSSTSSRDSENKRTFLNRYVRKVKSFIKK